MHCDNSPGRVVSSSTHMEPIIIFENKDVLVINKPAGLIVHSDGRTQEPSVAEWLLRRLPELVAVGEPWVSPQGEIIARPGIVHRLDRTTSGIMIIAKNQEAFLHLKAQFHDRAVEKTYLAYTYGAPKEDAGVIEAEIGRSRSEPRQWSAQFGKKGNLRAAVTEWRVLGRFVDRETGESVGYMELSPKTGRTHQIRVHLKAIHHPIVCDHLYAPKHPRILGFSRPALHAKTLSLTLPDGQHATWEAPLPQDFLHAAELLGNLA